MTNQHVDTKQLITFAEEGLSAEEENRISAHLSSCERCYGELIKISNVYSSVAYYFKSLPKSDNCPETSVLRDYLDETIAESKREEIATHLAGCDHCFDLVSSMLGNRIHQWNLGKLVEGIKSRVEKIRRDAEEKLTQVGNWLEGLFVPTSRLAYAGVSMRTRGAAIRTKGSLGNARIGEEIITAQLVDNSGMPVEETVTFNILSSPRIDEHQQFRMELSTSSLEYEGYLLNVSLRKGNQYLELGSVSLDLVDDVLKASVSINLSKTGVSLKGGNWWIPLRFIELSLRPAV